MYKSNCHTHTNYCDGKASAEDVVKEAVRRGFNTLGFSGHCPMSFKSTWEMSCEDLEKYWIEVNRLKEIYREKIEILCGIELDSDYKFDNSYEFDYRICSVHQLHKNGKVYFLDYSPEMSSECVEKEFGGNWNEMAKEYYNTLTEFILEEKCDIVGHYDLITKFNERNSLFDEDEEYRRIALSCLEKIIEKKPGILFEVNTGAMFRCNNSKPYPSEFIMKKIYELGGKVTVSSDAHQPDALDYAFDTAKAYCKKCGFNKIYHLTGQGIIEENI